MSLRTRNPDAAVRDLVGRDRNAERFVEEAAYHRVGEDVVGLGRVGQGGAERRGRHR